MAKTSPVKAFRQQAAARSRLLGIGVNPNSAYNRIGRANDQVDGRMRELFGSDPKPRSGSPTRYPGTPRPDPSSSRTVQSVRWEADGSMIVTPTPRKSVKTYIGTFSKKQTKKPASTGSKPTGITKSPAIYKGTKRPRQAANPQVQVKGLARKFTRTPSPQSPTGDSNNPSVTPSPTHSANNSNDDEEPYERWAPCNGVNPLAHKRQARAAPTETLGIARIASFREASFISALEKLLREKDVQGDIQIAGITFGGEELVDVEVIFQDAEVCGDAWRKLDGEVVEGRKLGIFYL